MWNYVECRVLNAAADGAGRHRPAARIRRTVMLGAHQIPEYGDVRFAGHEGGDFIFVRRDARAATGDPADASSK
jgi:hypothetical protein